MTLYPSSHPQLRYHPLSTGGPFSIVGGAAGWIDTDVSAITGIDPTRVFLISMQATAAQDGGARAHGSALTPSQYVNLTNFGLSAVDSTGHMDLLRGAANMNYYIIGYIERAV